MPKMTREMRERFKFGKMAQDMKKCGKKTYPLSTVDSSSCLVIIFMIVTIKKTRKPPVIENKLWI